MLPASHIGGCLGTCVPYLIPANFALSRLRCLSGSAPSVGNLESDRWE